MPLEPPPPPHFPPPHFQSVLDIRQLMSVIIMLEAQEGEMTNNKHL